MKQKRAMGLILSFGLEVFCSQVLFIYIPLTVIFDSGNEIIGSVTRATAYIGPVLFGFYIGHIIDSSNKRTLGFAVSLSIAILTALFSLFGLFENIYFTISYLFSASICTYFLNNLRVTVLPTLIKESQLSNVNSTLLIVENAALLAAPAISSIMMKWATPADWIIFFSICFLLSSLLYLYSLNGVKYDKTKMENIGFIQSLNIILTNKQLLVLIIAMMGNNAFVGVFSLYIMIHAFDSGLFSSTETPFILIASAIGAMLSGLLATKAINFLGANVLVVICGISLAITGIIPIIFSYKESYYLASSLEGFLSSWLVVCVWTMRQKLVSKDVLGKVTGITSSLFKLSMIVSIPLSGLLSTYYGSNFSLISASIWIIVFILPIIAHSLQTSKDNNNIESVIE